MFVLTISAQEDKDILLTINDEPISVGEYKSVYLKNIDILKDKTFSNPEKYLDLFIPYKLKVQEAYRLGLDKKDTYKTELSGYKKQLAKTFLTDVSISDQLVKEAYDRLVTEVSTRHILVKVTPNAAPEDTLVAYNRILEARSKILEGEDFVKVAKTYSADPSVKVNGGDLGWFKAFKMVYPFENAAYTTPVGEISMPFKTRFGYHIVQTTGSRPAKGAVKVSHIMITHKQEDTTVNPQMRIAKIYDLLQQGKNFESLAKTYSNDTQTASKGGELRKFESGQLSSPEFEKVAFQLRNSGEYSKPFASKFGWHIVKLIEKFPVPSFEDHKTALEDKVRKDKRSQVISQSLINKLRKQYKAEDISSIIAMVSDTTVGTFKDNKYVYTSNELNDVKEVFKIKETTYYLPSLGKYLERSFDPRQFGSYEQFFKETVRKYIDIKVRSYHEEHLEEIEPEFANILREYKEGLLIFDLMEQEIWNKAKNDSLGLSKFYDKNTHLYKEAASASTAVYTSQNKVVLETFKNVLENRTDGESISLPKEIIKTKKQLVIDNKDSYALNFKPVVGISKVFTHNDGYVLYDISKLNLARTKTLEEARGMVISDYQKQLEDTWTKGLGAQANVVIEKKALKKLIKQLQ